MRGQAIILAGLLDGFDDGRAARLLLKAQTRFGAEDVHQCASAY
jgi:hypothetical protein